MADKLCIRLIKTFAFLLITFLLFIIFGYETVSACDRNAGFEKRVSACEASSCGSTNRWEAYMAYATSKDDFDNNKYCSQKEYFASQADCLAEGPLASNLCPSGCTEHSQCGTGGTCADGNLGAGEICKGNYFTSNKWCVQTLCGWKCGAAPDYCYVKTAYAARTTDQKMGFDNDQCGQCVPPTTTTTPIICSDLSRENLTYSCQTPTSSGSCPSTYTKSSLTQTDCSNSGQVCCYYSGGPRS